MNKSQNNFVRASALQISLSLVLISISASLPASSLTVLPQRLPGVSQVARAVGEKGLLARNNHPNKSVPTLSAVAAPFTLHKPAGGPSLVGVVSRKTHGAAGDFDIDLPGIECRLGGVNSNYKLVFTFTNPLTSVASVNATATGATQPGASSGMIDPMDPHKYIANLTMLPNAQYITVTLNNVVDSQNNTGNVAATMGLLVGDSTGEGLVNSSDIVLNKLRAGQVVDQTNFRSELNGNGAINAADIVIAKSRSGTGLPGVTVTGSPNQSLSFSSPGTIDLSTATQFTVSVSATFSGYNSYGLSYWMETNVALSGYISVSSASYFTFADANQLTPNPAQLNSTIGASSSFVSENRDLGATVNDPTQNVVMEGTYHITDVTLTLDPNTPNGTYTLRWTTVGPRFSEVTDASVHDNYVTSVGSTTFTVVGVGAPHCGVISGTITDAQGAVAGALVQACETNNGPCSFNATTNATGNYQITNLPLNRAFNLTVFPPSGSVDLPGQLLNRTVSGPDCSTPLTGQNLMLQQPPPPPPPGAIEPHTTGAGGVPVVYWNSPLTLTTTGCPNGTASFMISLGASTIASGSMMQTSAGSGTYVASVAPLYPSHGVATVTMTILCPDNTTETLTFNIYIDPSGIVQDSHGVLLAGATVTLLRSDSASGPFTVVPDGSAIMSPGNRTNPDLTDALGHFGWDVLAGFYKVRAEHAGCNGIVETGVLRIPPPVTDLVLTLDCPTELMTAVSLKTHGGAGNFTINLPLSGQPGVECRTGGANGDHTLVFTFSNNIVSGDADVTNGMGNVAGSPTFAANTMTVNLTDVTNAQTLTVTLSNVTDTFNQVLPDVVLSADFLLGDANGNRAVNATDVTLTKSRIGQPINQTNARSDVNADGGINASDVLIIKSKLGTGLP